MRELVDRYRAVEAENAELRRRLEESQVHGKAVDDRLLEINQRRQDAMKRLDDVIALVDHLDARFEALASD